MSPKMILERNKKEKEMDFKVFTIHQIYNIAYIMKVDLGPWSPKKVGTPTRTIEITVHKWKNCGK